MLKIIVILFLASVLYLIKLRRDNKKYVDALEFYADPRTYFAIGFLPDPPCGDFIDDFDHTGLGNKPGKKAREALKEFNLEELR